MASEVTDIPHKVIVTINCVASTFKLRDMGQERHCPFFLHLFLLCSVLKKSPDSIKVCACTSFCESTKYISKSLFVL